MIFQYYYLFSLYHCFYICSICILIKLLLKYGKIHVKRVIGAAFFRYGKEGRRVLEGDDIYLFRSECETARRILEGGTYLRDVMFIREYKVLRFNNSLPNLLCLNLHLTFNFRSTRTLRELQNNVSNLKI